MSEPIKRDILGIREHKERIRELLDELEKCIHEPAA